MNKNMKEIEKFQRGKKRAYAFFYLVILSPRYSKPCSPLFQVPFFWPDHRDEAKK